MPEDAAQIMGKCAVEIEQHLHAIVQPHTNPHVVTINALLDSVLQTRLSRDNMTAVRLLQKVTYFKVIVKELRNTNSDYFRR